MELSPGVFRRLCAARDPIEQFRDGRIVAHWRVTDDASRTRQLDTPD